MKIELLKINGRFELLKVNKFLDEDLDSKCWEKDFLTDEFESNKAEEFIRNIAEMCLLDETNSEYLVVDSNKKINDSECEAIKRNIVIQVIDANSGYFLGQGDYIKGVYNKDTRIFTEK